MRDILRMARIQMVVIALFAIAKFIRPTILKSDSPELFKLFLLSFPNLCEAILGILTLTMIGIYLNQQLKWKDQYIYLLAILLAAIYVISQELKFHHIGGNNVYDPNDLIFSIFGLTLGGILIASMRPKMQ